MHWQQREDQEILEPALDIPITPRFFHLNPGEAQVIRALFPSQSKQYFRILIEQVPPAIETEGIALNFKFSLPVYHFNNEPATRTIEFPADEPCVIVSNPTERVQQLEADVALQGVRMLLPRATMRVCKRASKKL